MEAKYVVDLSQRLVSGKEANFHFELDLKDAMESLPDFTHDEDVWYKIGYVSMCTHNSTHVEVPYHHMQEGLDIADFPINRMIGNIVVLDLRGKSPGDIISKEQLMAYDDQIKPGDFVILKEGMDKTFRSPQWNDYPYVALDGIQYLLDKGVSCMGTDAAGIENPNAHNQPGHMTLFRGNVPLVESLTNLDSIESGKYIGFVLPLPIERGDASPVRVVAVSKEGLKQLLA